MRYMKSYWDTMNTTLHIQNQNEAIHDKGKMTKSNIQTNLKTINSLILSKTSCIYYPNRSTIQSQSS